jgi:hypothetical protein
MSKAKTIRLINAEQDIKDLGEWIEKGDGTFAALSTYRLKKGGKRPKKHHIVLGSSLDAGKAEEAARKKCAGPKHPEAALPVALFEHIKNVPSSPLKWWLDTKKVYTEAA